MSHFPLSITLCRQFGRQNVGRSEPVGAGRHLYIGM